MTHSFLTFTASNCTYIACRWQRSFPVEARPAFTEACDGLLPKSQCTSEGVTGLTYSSEPVEVKENSFIMCIVDWEFM